MSGLTAHAGRGPWRSGAGHPPPGSRPGEVQGELRRGHPSTRTPLWGRRRTAAAASSPCSRAPEGEGGCGARRRDGLAAQTACAAVRARPAGEASGRMRLELRVWVDPVPSGAARREVRGGSARPRQRGRLDRRAVLSPRRSPQARAALSVVLGALPASRSAAARGADPPPGEGAARQLQPEPRPLSPAGPPARPPGPRPARKSPLGAARPKGFPRKCLRGRSG